MVSVTYPGVYVQELESNAHEIIGASTAVTAFVGVFERGPTNVPTQVTNFGEFSAIFGGLVKASKAGYGIYQFFQNGGQTAWVVRIAGDGAAAATASAASVALVANGPGSWGDSLQAAIQPNSEEGLFDLVLREVAASTGSRPHPNVVASEVYLGLSAKPDHPMYVVDVLQHQSQLALADGVPGKLAVDRSGAAVSGAESILNPSNIQNPAFDGFADGQFSGGVDDLTIAGPRALGREGDTARGVDATGMFTLRDIAPSSFNLLCLPAMASFSASAWVEAYSTATNFCVEQQAFLIADPPVDEIYESTEPAAQARKMQVWFENLSGKSDHSAVYFPLLEIPDPAKGGAQMVTEVSGTLAGVYARTDFSEGVWKAPAGTGATLSSVLDLTVSVDDATNGLLNPVGINALRRMPLLGVVSWGARTMRGSDVEQSEWKYIPVRRLALYIEQSVQQSTAWVVFEPNDEALWSSLRMAVTGFMDGLYKQGAFAASSANEAYYVKCDHTTTTPSDVDQGIVNLVVGFAPLVPAEFVVLTFSLRTASG